MNRSALIEDALESARVERLLDRLDPAPVHTCDVPDCLHVREEESLPAAAQEVVGPPRGAGR